MRPVATGREGTDGQRTETGSAGRTIQVIEHVLRDEQTHDGGSDDDHDRNLGRPPRAVKKSAKPVPYPP